MFVIKGRPDVDRHRKLIKVWLASEEDLENVSGAGFEF